MKKLAAVLELTNQEIKYLLHGLSNLDSHYNSGNRDYNREEMHEKLQLKLIKAAESFK